MKSLDRPLNAMFVITSMPVGGAETLLVNLVRSFDNRRIRPQICCLKDRDVLGDEIAATFPVHCNLIRSKWDIGVVSRLRSLFQKEKIDVVVTVGAGDKMFWGRIGARLANVPVILSALHSTGWPDGVGRLNRFLTPLTDGFIGVAKSHGEFLVEFEKFPLSRVFVIPNGIDTERFVFSENHRREWRERLGIPDDSPVVGIVAALRPEKNHRLFLETARRTLAAQTNCHFAIAGDGPLRPDLESYANELGIADHVHFVGNVSETPGFLSALDLFALTSDNEASPVSIVEAMACRRPIVATRVGSVSELVVEGETGLLVPPKNVEMMASAWLSILQDTNRGDEFGLRGRVRVCKTSSLNAMVDGYTRLAEKLYSTKTGVQVKRVQPIQAPPMPATDLLQYSGRFK